MDSYWYNFDSNYWSAVYKRTYAKDFKFKAGYDSEVRLGWASLWVYSLILHLNLFGRNIVTSFLINACLVFTRILFFFLYDIDRNQILTKERT